jgi:hypothetical protein
LRLTALAAAAAGLLAVAPATASAEPHATTYVHSAKRGELRGGRLALHGIRRKVTWVSHDGRSGALSVATLHRALFAHLAPRGFPRSNRRLPAPTALLHVAQRPGRVAALRLSRPRYSAARRTVSYRVKRLDKRRLPRRFGAASLSIAALGSPQDVFHCSTTVENGTDYTIQATSSGLWPQDRWNPGIPVGYLSLPDSPSDTLVYGSDGGFMRGCGNSSTWTIIDGPPGIRGVHFDFYTTIPWNISGVPTRGSSTCTPSAPNFVCQGDPGGLNFWTLQPAR